MAAGAEFCLLGKFRLNFFPIGALCLKLQSLSSLTKLPNVVCNRLWKWYATALCNLSKLPRQYATTLRNRLWKRYVTLSMTNTKN